MNTLVLMYFLYFTKIVNLFSKIKNLNFKL